MKERFKFRFFDKVSKEMCYPTEYNGKAEYLERRYDLADMFRFKDLIPMQSTGLKDRNGKLIYEGDLLKTRFGLILKVYWREQSAMFWLETLDGVIPFTFYAKQQLDGDLMEVIGNIYENKELLLKEKLKSDKRGKQC